MTSKQCPQCGSGNEAVASTCSNCGFSFFHTLKPKWDKPNQPPVTLQQTNVYVENSSPTYAQIADSQFQVGSFRQILGVAGSVILFLGVFAPIISAPIIGSINYFRNGTGDGVIIIILAAISAILAFRKEFRGLVATGALSLAVLGFTFINFRYRVGQAQSQVDPSNPFSEIGARFIELVQIEWGWAVLIFGAGVLIATGLMKRDALNIQISSNR